MKTEKTFSRIKNSKGFTLIELMIGIAIIGVLAAIAIPAFQDYLNRSKVTELVNLAQACKVGVVEAAATTNAWPANAGAAGCQSNLGTSRYATALTVGANGRIQVTFRANAVANTITGNNFIALIPWTGTARHNSAVTPIPQWRCVTNVAGDNLRFIPASCRNPNVP